MNEPLEQYRRRADAFERLVARAPASTWGAPSPCEGWTAADVVAHVVDFTAHVLADQAGISDAPRYSDHDGPLSAFRAARERVERLLGDPATPADVATAMQWSISFDLRQHGWDLAMATGQDATMDPEDVSLLWGPGDPVAFEEAFGWQREQGWYGPPVPVADDAPVQDRVLGLLGRDPSWKAP